MDNYTLHIKYGTDKRYTRIAASAATGPMSQVLAYLSIHIDYALALSDTGKIKIKIRPTR